MEFDEIANYRLNDEHSELVMHHSPRGSRDTTRRRRRSGKERQEREAPLAARICEIYANARALLASPSSLSGFSRRETIETRHSATVFYCSPTTTTTDSIRPSDTDERLRSLRRSLTGASLAARRDINDTLLIDVVTLSFAPFRSFHPFSTLFLYGGISERFARFVRFVSFRFVS